MPDVYASIAEADESIQAQLASVLELRAADPQQQAMLQDYLADLELPPDTRALELGCGTGAITEVLASLERVGRVIGVDPSPVFVAQAQPRSRPGLAFEQGERARPAVRRQRVRPRRLPHRALSRAGAGAGTGRGVPGPEAGRSDTRCFDGDYATITVALGEADPLQACVEEVADFLIHDRWLARRLRPMLAGAGFETSRLRSHGYAETENPGYTLTLLDRGADLLAAHGRVGPETAEALKAEARRRAEWRVVRIRRLRQRHRPEAGVAELTLRPDPGYAFSA